MVFRFRILGLTGQICSGKTTAAQYLHSKYNATVIEIDKVNREVLETEEVRREIRKKFGDEVFAENNTLDRLKMRQLIYNDPKEKKYLKKLHIQRCLNYYFPKF